MKEILDDVLTLLGEGEDFALAKLIGDRGSTPRAAGAEMLVRRDGSIAGTIGGGLLELTMMKQAVKALKTHASRVVDLGLSGTDLTNDQEMVCGGKAEVLITYVSAGDQRLREVLVAAKAAMAARDRAWLFTLLPLENGGSVETCLLRDDGTVVGAPCDPTALRVAVGKIAVHGSTRLPDGHDVVVEQIEVPARVIVCGGGHVGRALAPAALAAGFAVTVLDDREEFADQRRFPSEAETATGPFDRTLKRLEVDDASYVVIVTRGHTHDIDVLLQALRTPARYIGLMGSRSKRFRILQALKNDGLDDAFARIHTPIGLDIGAETPAELAVSIVAELIQVRSGKAV